MRTEGCVGQSRRSPVPHAAPDHQLAASAARFADSADRAATATGGRIPTAAAVPLEARPRPARPAPARPLAAALPSPPGCGARACSPTRPPAHRRRPWGSPPPGQRNRRTIRQMATSQPPAGVSSSRRSQRVGDTAAMNPPRHGPATRHLAHDAVVLAAARTSQPACSTCTPARWGGSPQQFQDRTEVMIREQYPSHMRHPEPGARTSAPEPLSDAGLVLAFSAASGPGPGAAEIRWLRQSDLDVDTTGQAFRGCGCPPPRVIREQVWSGRGNAA
jgi:hypothetical protein